MRNYILEFQDIDKSKVSLAGGKGANLGELYNVPRIVVPTGFCITTNAYADFIGESLEFRALLDSLKEIDSGSFEDIRVAAKGIRSHLEGLEINKEIQHEIVQAWEKIGTQYSYAVRSSATAEDLPNVSFAGQQDTYLNIIGRQNILDSTRRCWASLFTERAIIYRQKNGFEHDKVLLSVIVQRMIFPKISGIMFTADPITGNRKIVSIDASFGLGEALVSGMVSADLYQVKSDKLIKKQLAKKEMAIYARPEGGTSIEKISGDKQTKQTLADHQAIKLAHMGKRLEQHFGSPQDIEWGLVDEKIFILQSRPITTLYPVPSVADEKLHIFMSIGHPQMMIDAIKPLGISVLRTFAPLGRSYRHAESSLLLEAGGRLYLDITKALKHKQGRKMLPGILMNVDALMSQAIAVLIGRAELEHKSLPPSGLDYTLVKSVLPMGMNVIKNILYRRNYGVIDQINDFIIEKVEESKTKLEASSGVQRVEQIQEILYTLMPMVFAKIGQYMGTAILTYKLIAGLSQKWLGDMDEIGDISKSPSGNVTTEMGLALGDIADAVKKYPSIIDFLKNATNDNFLNELSTVPEGKKVLPLFVNFIKRYGMRGTGEIDITRPRWRENPTQLVAVIMSHIHNLNSGQHRQDFLQGRKEADDASAKLINRLERTPWGVGKAMIMKRLIKVHRSLIGLREHPKYFLVQNFDLIKQALLQEGKELTDRNVLKQSEDVFFLSLDEIKEGIHTGNLDHSVIAKRKEKFQHDQKLVPPRVMTSEGEIITGRYEGMDIPPGALAGSPVSAGIIEGRARVVLTLEEAAMEKGDILVTAFTDPSWTPLFPLVSALVTEVGGLMTHGAVIAREYGIPAVVGVENATRTIKDGQRIRVDGTRGFVEILT
ncbi:MAG: phosphoenolpyruvate synthase [Sporomusaceae bacterium]|nr:phosphoenolpyruvate synthase [Sporomusaceae bacterium]